MGDITAKDLMVPIAEYATVREDATIADAILAMEKVEKEFSSKQPHRTLLVIGKNNKVVGKLSESEIIRSLDPKYGKIGQGKQLSRAGVRSTFLKSAADDALSGISSFREACKNATKYKVKNIMHTPSEGEYAKENTPLVQALYQVVINHRHSLLITRGDEIVGVLRLSDGFKAVCDEIKAASKP